MSDGRDLAKIEKALLSAREAVSQFTPGRIESDQKAGGDPVTQADLLLDAVLKESLLESGDGWLSEETADDLNRLGCERVWIVDPIDGTREFIQGIPEWCISVALVVSGIPVCGGICNPPADQLFLGCAGRGVTLNGHPVQVSSKANLNGATVLASRSEVQRGEWTYFENAPFTIIPMGSIAYKLAQVAAGLADATFTPVPKNEWDIAAGVCLIQSSGGQAADLTGQPRQFNRSNPLLGNFLAANPGLWTLLKQYMVNAR